MEDYSDEKLPPLFDCSDSQVACAVNGTDMWLDVIDWPSLESCTSGETPNERQNDQSKKRKLVSEGKELSSNVVYTAQRYTCSLCNPPTNFSGKDFSTFYRKHLCTVHKLPTYSCYVSTCSAYFNFKNELIKHMKDDHKEYECDQCPSRVKFSDYTKFVSHYCHYNHSLHTCKYEDCKKEFREERQLFEHLVGEHYGIDLISPEYLTQSVKKIRTAAPCQQYECWCSFSTDKIYIFRNHVFREHAILSYSCEYPSCQERFSSRKNLTNHRSGHQVHNQVHTCGKCNTSHISGGAYKKHCSLVHDNQVYWCKFCSKTFSRDKDLLMHEVHNHFSALSS